MSFWMWGVANSRFVSICLVLSRTLARHTYDEEVHSLELGGASKREILQGSRRRELL